MDRKVLFFIVKHRYPYLQNYSMISILHICKFDYLFTQNFFLALQSISGGEDNIVFVNSNYISKITIQQNYDLVDFPESKKSLLSPHFAGEVGFFN